MAATPDGYRRIGTVGKPHGLKGEFTLIGETDLPEWVAEQACLTLQQGATLTETDVRGARFHKDRLLLKLAALPGRNEVEAARGQALLVTEEAAAQAPDEDFFYNSDLIGCALLDADDNTPLGEAVDVIELPGHNLIEVKRGDSIYHVPFVSAIVATVDLETRQIHVRLPEGLDDLDKL